jgi:OTU domain-containing protein 3
MPEDGNCLFHSLCDQLPATPAAAAADDDGGGGGAEALRRRVMDHVEAHPDSFAPFVEDDEPFSDYVVRLREDGTWAGNLEVQAASLVLRSNVRIYQAGQPCWTVRNFPDVSLNRASSSLVACPAPAFAPWSEAQALDLPAARSPQSAPLLHLSYHDGQHYNSVRLADDYGAGPPLPVVAAPQAGAAAPSGGGASAWGDAEIKELSAGTGCAARGRLEAALQRSGGDVASAIEALIEELGAEGSGGETEEPAAPAAPQLAAPAQEPEAAAAGAQPDGQAGSNEPVEAPVEVRLVVGPSGRVDLLLRVHNEGGGASGGHRKAGVKLRKDKKRAGKEPAAGRNSKCPCGSKRKHRNCCGAAAGARAAAHGDPVAAGEAAQALKELYI